MRAGHVQESSDRDGYRQYVALTVALLKSGWISLSETTYTELGGPQAVELLFDAGAEIVGFRAVDEHSDTAHLIRVAGTKPQRSYSITALAFLRRYRIDVTVSRRWAAYVQDGVECMDLRGPAQVLSSNRANAELPGASGRHS